MAKHPANCKCKECKKKGSTVKGKAGKSQKLAESVHIANFVKSITEKNYSAANKYLQTVVREKIKTRIAQCADVKPF